MRPLLFRPRLIRHGIELRSATDRIIHAFGDARSIVVSIIVTPKQFL